MQWIPINRDLLTTLPTDRPYTRLEAAARITADRQDGTVRSMREYGRIFSWDSKTVKTFLDLQMIVTLTSAQKENNNRALQGDIPQSGNSALAPQPFRTDSTANINNSNGLQEDIPQSLHTDSAVTPQLLSRYRFKESLVASPKSKRPPSGDHQTFIAWWNYAYETTQGKPYLFAAKDAKAAKTLLGLHPLKPLLLIASHFLTVEDTFLANRRDLPMLQSQINRMPPPGEIMTNNAARFRAAGLLPPDGTLLEDWRFWETTAPG